MRHTPERWQKRRDRSARQPSAANMTYIQGATRPRYMSCSAVGWGRGGSWGGGRSRAGQDGMLGVDELARSLSLRDDAPGLLAVHMTVTTLRLYCTQQWLKEQGQLQEDSSAGPTSPARGGVSLQASAAMMPAYHNKHLSTRPSPDLPPPLHPLALTLSTCCASLRLRVLVKAWHPSLPQALCILRRIALCPLTPSAPSSCSSSSCCRSCASSRDGGSCRG